MFQRAWTDAPGSIGSATDGHRRAGRQRRRAGRLVHAVDGAAGIFRPAERRPYFRRLMLAKFTTCTFHEILALSPLVVFIVWIGVYPQLFLKPIAPAAETILARTSQPLENYYAKRQVAALEIAAPAERQNVAANRACPARNQLTHDRFLDIPVAAARDHSDRRCHAALRAGRIQPAARGRCCYRARLRWQSRESICSANQNWWNIPRLLAPSSPDPWSSICLAMPCNGAFWPSARC